jgi:hypothetical protein
MRRLAEHNLVDEAVHGWEYRHLKKPDIYEHQCLES